MASSGCAAYLFVTIIFVQRSRKIIAPRSTGYLPHPQYRRDIDGLRAVAILSVIGFHAFPNSITGGFIGVDVFFVISGFLISTIIFGGLETNRFSFPEFYARRIKRIFPALLIILTASYVFGWFALLSDEYKQLGKHISAGAGFISNFVFLDEAGYFDNSADTKPLLHLWSLAIEEQFYIAWPLMLWLAWKGRSNTILICLLLILVSFAFNVKSVGKDVMEAFYLPVTRFWELTCGSLLAYVTLHRPLSFTQIENRIDSAFNRMFPVKIGIRKCISLRDTAAIVGVLLIAIAIFAVTKKTLFPGWWALLPTLGAFLLIWAGPHAWFNKVVLGSSVLVWVGLISYPLYLWHWPILSFARITDGQIPALRVRIVAVICSFFLAWLTYRFIERPIRWGQGKSILLCVLMTTIGLVGYGTFTHHGLTFRHKAFEDRVKAIKHVQESTIACKHAIPVKELRYCNLANPAAEPTVVVIGDSHGNALYAPLAEKYTTMGENLLQIGGGGCLPFWDVETGLLGQPFGCNVQMNAQLNFLLQNKNIRTVILAYRGPLHIEGDDPATGQQYFIRDTTNPSNDDRKQIYRNGLLQTARKLKGSGKKVLVIIDQPEFPYDTLSCVDLTRPLSIPFGEKPNCRMPRSIVDGRNRNYLEITRSVAAKADLKIINIQDVLCDEEGCSALKNGLLLYRDADHLNQFGARHVIQKLWPQFVD